RLRGYSIIWGRKRKTRPRDQIVFGTIQEEDRLIRIHPLLDRYFVPTWFLEYVIYHEMCHAVVKDEFDSAGRRLVHHEKFYERESRFHWIRRAKKWEQENLARFLQERSGPGLQRGLRPGGGLFSATRDLFGRRQGHQNFWRN